MILPSDMESSVHAAIVQLAHSAAEGWEMEPSLSHPCSDVIADIALELESEEEERTCQGCVDGAPGQSAHMGFGGCLEHDI